MTDLLYSIFRLYNIEGNRRGGSVFIYPVSRAKFNQITHLLQMSFFYLFSVADFNDW